MLQRLSVCLVFAWHSSAVASIRQCQLIFCIGFQTMLLRSKSVMVPSDKGSHITVCPQPWGCVGTGGDECGVHNTAWNFWVSHFINEQFLPISFGLLQVKPFTLKHTCCVFAMKHTLCFLLMAGHRVSHSVVITQSILSDKTTLIVEASWSVCCFVWSFEVFAGCVCFYLVWAQIEFLGAQLIAGPGELAVWVCISQQKTSCWPALNYSNYDNCSKLKQSCLITHSTEYIREGFLNYL